MASVLFSKHEQRGGRSGKGHADGVALDLQRARGDAGGAVEVIAVQQAGGQLHGRVRFVGGHGAVALEAHGDEQGAVIQLTRAHHGGAADKAVAHHGRALLGGQLGQLLGALVQVAADRAVGQGDAGDQLHGHRAAVDLKEAPALGAAGDVLALLAVFPVMQGVVVAVRQGGTGHQQNRKGQQGQNTLFHHPIRGPLRPAPSLRCLRLL